jgi:7-cyano-7-deazaguanine reductase
VLITDDSARAAKIVVFFGKPPYPNAPFSPLSNGLTWKTAVFRRGMLEFSRMSSTILETFPNPRPERDYEITINCPEFTSVCPKTGLPDFGEIRIAYVPDARCVELKSLKYYMIGFRNLGIFYEHVTNQILDDLVAALQPRRMTVVGDFSVRGGLKTIVTATYGRP